jgi:hypothetical protein
MLRLQCYSGNGFTERKLTRKTNAATGPILQAKILFEAHQDPGFLLRRLTLAV